MRTRRVIPLVLVALAATACAKQKGKDAAAPGGGGADPLADAEARLADNAARMRAIGITLDEDAKREAPATEVAPPPPPSPAEPGSPEPTTTTPEPATPPKASEAEAAGTASSGSDRCTQICELAEVACELEGHICRLAESHVGEPRYEDACWRARDQCEHGQDACSACSASA